MAPAGGGLETHAAALDRRHPRHAGTPNDMAALAKLATAATGEALDVRSRATSDSAGPRAGRWDHTFVLLGQWMVAPGLGVGANFRGMNARTAARAENPVPKRDRDAKAA